MEFDTLHRYKIQDEMNQLVSSRHSLLETRPTVVSRPNTANGPCSPYLTQWSGRVLQAGKRDNQNVWRALGGLARKLARSVCGVMVSVKSVCGVMSAGIIINLLFLLTDCPRLESPPHLECPNFSRFGDLLSLWMEVFKVIDKTI